MFTKIEFYGAEVNDYVTAKLMIQKFSVTIVIPTIIEST